MVAEESVVDAHGLISEVPTRERGLDRAAEFGVDRVVAVERIERLDTLDTIDVEDGYVYPDENCSRIRVAGRSPLQPASRSPTPLSTTGGGRGGARR